MYKAIERRKAQGHHDRRQVVESDVAFGEGVEGRYERDAEGADRAGSGNAGDALGAVGDRQRQSKEPCDLGEHQRHHGEVDAAQS